MTHSWPRILLVTLLAATAPAAPLFAAVQLLVGPTPIPDGEAVAARDVTVMNERLAFGLAVESSAPYGIPRGAIVDLAPVVDGKPARDRVVFADFIPNYWSAWPNTYQKIDIVERGPQQVVVRTLRDWGKVTIATTYTLRSNADRIELQTTMTNTGDVAIADILSGQTLWPSAGYFFRVPAVAAAKNGTATRPLADRAVAYDEDWFIALHAPYLVDASKGPNDLVLQHTLAPGASRTFDAWLQVGPRGDLGPVVAAEIERKRLATGSVRGTVTTRDGKPVAEPVIVVAQQGVPYAWTLGRGGRYEMPLPAGDYDVYATGKGYSQSKAVSLQVRAGADISTDFRDLEPPGRVEFQVVESNSGQPLDARISITSGQRPLVEFLGRSTFFTALDRKGHTLVSIAPGAYDFKVSSGGGFLGPDQDVRLEVRAGETLQSGIRLTRLFDPTSTGWYAADLHHHADQAEGVTPPDDLARSQLAAGLDLLFVSDHDSTVNHAPLQKIAAARGVPFIPSLEISPSWGHFNAWPLQPGQKLAIDTSTATIDQVLAEARRQGAIVVQSNHPFISYGYLTNAAAGLVPGGFNPAFDLAELNGDVGRVDEAMPGIWPLWNAGHRYYLTAGTDVHDVWNFESGRIRLFAHVAGPVTPAAFAQAAKDGHAYVSYGPLIEPSVMFGSELKVKPGESFRLAFALRSAGGLKQARLIGAGSVVATRAFTGAPRDAPVDFPLVASGRTWYSVEVEDVAGRKAYSNPIWVDVVDVPRSPPAL